MPKKRSELACLISVLELNQEDVNAHAFYYIKASGKAFCARAGLELGSPSGSLFHRFRRLTNSS